MICLLISCLQVVMQHVARLQVMQHVAQISALECPACHDLHGKFSPYSISVDGNLKISNWARSQQRLREPDLLTGWAALRSMLRSMLSLPSMPRERSVMNALQWAFVLRQLLHKSLFLYTVSSSEPCCCRPGHLLCVASVGGLLKNVLGGMRSKMSLGWSLVSIVLCFCFGRSSLLTAAAHCL